MTDPRHSPTTVPASRTDLPKKAAPNPKSKKILKGCGIALAVFVVLTIIGAIGAASKKRKAQEAAQADQVQPPTAAPLPLPVERAPAPVASDSQKSGITVDALLSAMPYLARYQGGQKEHAEKAKRTKEWWGYSWRKSDPSVEVKVGISSFADNGKFQMGFVMATSRSGSSETYTSALTQLIDLICVFAGRSDDAFRQETLTQVQQQCASNSKDMLSYVISGVSISHQGKAAAGPLFNASVEVK